MYQFCLMRFRRNVASIAKFVILLLICSVLILFLYNYLLNDEKRWALSNLKPMVDFKKDFDPYEKVDWHNYRQILSELEARGPGEQGTGVVTLTSENEAKEAIFKVNGFNGFASDKMSLNRSVKDIRHPDCKKQLYQAQLPTVSIIIPFYEEHWSTLLRTFISSLNRAPPGIVKEVILVDDCSTKQFLKKQLDDYLDKNYRGMVRVIRNAKREGLIRTRITGAKNATGDVLVFLDSHCEANTNWLPPLLDPIAGDYRTVVCPFIDVLDFDTFEYRAQDEGARGAFDWEFYYKRLPLLPEDLAHPARPFKSPVMAGGLFAISRKWFWELGGYDPGLDIWGGEQYELSFKIWQCGGTMVDAPCSRIGHVYRKYAPFPAVVSLGNFIARNYKRVAEVWMDDYKKFLYNRQPSWAKEKSGDLSAQYAIRDRLKCKPFKWFMTEIAFDLEKFYPSVEPPNSADGEIRSSVLGSDGVALCLDAKFQKSESKLQLSACVTDNSKLTGEQQFLLTWKEDVKLKSRGECLDVPNGNDKAPVVLFHCHGQKGNQLWKYVYQKKQLLHVVTNKCLTAHGPTKEVYVDVCVKGGDVSQQWTLQNVKTEVLKRYNQNLGLN